MYNNEKIYSIELGEDLTPPRPSGKPQEPAQAVPSRSRPARQENPRPPKPDVKAPRSGLQFASLMAMTWLLGPFSVHLHASRRGGRSLLTVGMVSGMAGLGMFAGRGFILDLIGQGWPVWLWAVLGAGVLVTAVSVWARTSFLACRDHRLPRHRLPALLRRPWVIGLTGLAAPGLGLLLAGCARRGAAVILAVGPVAGAAILLGNSWAVWNGNSEAGKAAMPPELLEMGFLVAALVLLAGLIGWVAQALEGARQMMEEPSIRHRLRGDWYAAALFCAMLGMAVVWDPAVMARQMDHGAIVLEEMGFRVIPLELAKTAHRLDPAPSEYAVRAIELYEELGRADEALRLREELDGNLASYLTLVQGEGKGSPRQAYAGRTPAQEWQIMSDLMDEHGQPGSRGRYQAR